MMRDSLITIGFMLATYLVGRGTWATLCDLEDLWRTVQRARRP